MKEDKNVVQRNYEAGRKCNLFVCNAMRHNLCSSAALQPIFLETRNPCGKVMERSGLRFPNIMFGSGLKSPRKKKFFFC